ncbi:DNA polymerase III subunit chi [Pseudomonas sp. Marseille-QA0892]
MPQIDFYILPSAETDARLTFACRLAEKAWRLGHRVYIHCEDGDQREVLDDRLWQFKGEAFIPHDNAEADPDATVVLGTDTPPQGQDDLLINLTTRIPPTFERFARVAEIVVEDATVRQAARQSFRFYRDRGYPLQDHRLTRI